jgi:hypothetical protein
MDLGWRKRRNFHRQPVAPSIFAIGDCRDLAPQVVVGLAVEHSRGRVNLPLPYPNTGFAILPDVLYPSGGFAFFGEQVDAFVADDKPNLDLARQSGRASDSSQMKDRLMRNALEIFACHQNHFLPIAQPL